MSSGKILVAQGGGPTAVINQSLAGVVLEALKKNPPVKPPVPVYPTYTPRMPAVK